MDAPLPSLPQCFLADLPAEAELTPDLVFQAWLSLERNRAQHLAGTATRDIIGDLEAAARLWLAPDSPYLNLALVRSQEERGFPAETLTNGLRTLFGSMTTPQLEAWIEQDLGHVNRLDDFCGSAAERAARRRARANGFNTLAHVTAGNVPPGAVMSLVAGLLVRSAQFVRCSTNGTLIPLLFAHSLREVNPHLASTIEIAAWPHERLDLQQALFNSADCITATGSDESITALRDAVPVHKRFVGYGHKVSFAYVAAETLAADQLESLANNLAADVCAWNQLGCLSPHVVYVEEGGTISPETLAGALAQALAAVEARQPRGPLSTLEAASIRSRRSFYAVRAANMDDTRLWQSEHSTAWTVVYERNPQFQPSCLHRFIYVKGISGLEEALQGADPIRHQVSTVGLHASGARMGEIATRLSLWGVTRLCRIGTMQHPPPLWRHDGRLTLSELVRWTDWEEA